MKDKKSFFNNLIDYMGTAIFLAIVVVCAAQVLSRYFFNKSIAWADNMAVYLMAFLAFVGAAKAALAKSHTRITFLVDHLPVKVRPIINLIGNVLCCIFCIIVAWNSRGFVETGMMSKTPILQIPYGLIYLILPVCMSITAIVFLFHIIQGVRAMCKGGEKE